MSRSERRHHADRIKARAAKVYLRWRRRTDPMVKSTGTSGTTYYTAKELQRNIGTMAAMHCTHICFMCHHEKILGLPHIKSRESVRVFSLE